MNKYLKMAIIWNTKITLTDTARLNFTKIYGENQRYLNVNGKKKVMRMQECACTCRGCSFKHRMSSSLLQTWANSTRGS